MLTEEEALAKAKQKLSIASHYSECGSNDGIRAIYSDEAEWLCTLFCIIERLKAEIEQLKRDAKYSEEFKKIVEQYSGGKQ